MTPTVLFDRAAQVDPYRPVLLQPKQRMLVGMACSCRHLAARFEVFKQVSNAPAEAALAELNGRRQFSSPMETAESGEADAEKFGTLSRAQNSLFVQALRERRYFSSGDLWSHS